MRAEIIYGTNPNNNRYWTKSKQSSENHCNYFGEFLLNQLTRSRFSHYAEHWAALRSSNCVMKFYSFRKSKNSYADLEGNYEYIFDGK